MTLLISENVCIKIEINENLARREGFRLIIPMSNEARFLLSTDNINFIISDNKKRISQAVIFVGLREDEYKPVVMQISVFV